MHMSKVGNFENDDGVYKTLLESTKAIPWKIDWASMKFSYIGPQIEALLGWSADSWVSVEDWAMRMHPDDRERVVNFCVAQSQAGIDHEADYRALTKDNGYVWIRDVVHVVRNSQGEAEALVGFMFDISERKKTEEKLLSLQKELEVLSFKDGLTNIANRRSFDAHFEAAWEQAQREQQPLSVLLFDVDFFKQYNDLYGHIQGDGCLIDIAQMLSLALDGPGSGGALRRRGIYRAAARSQRRSRAQGGRALPAPDPEKIHRACTVTVQPARDRQHRCGHRGARRGGPAHRFPECRGSAAVCRQAPWPQPD